MNVFLPRLKHYHWLMKFMVKKSCGLIFINKIYQNEFAKKYPKIYEKSASNHLIFNGVNKFWLEKSEFSLNFKNDDNLLYVGSFNSNKNIHSIISACDKVLVGKPGLKLILVGGNEDDLKKLLNIKEIPEYIKCMGVLNDNKKLLEIYKQSKIFIMPSFFETFGLVYIEALLQGCSLIHSRGQGIDGIFNEDFIQSVDPYDVNDIAEKIDFLLDNFHLRKFDSNFNSCIKRSFNWDSIADQYLRAFEK